MNEDAANDTFDLTNVFSDAEDNDGNLTFSMASNSNSSLLNASVDNGTDQLILDYQANQSGSADITIRAKDSGGLTVDDAFTVTVNNLAPVFNSSSTASFAENGTGTVLDVNADNGGDGSNDSGVDYSITGGTDSGALSINTSTGELIFDSAPDFENPTDSDGQNDYVVDVTADDNQSSNNTTTQTITVTVTDVNEPPTLTLGATSGSVGENNSPPNVLTTITINDDALGTNGLSLSGADAGAFQIDGSDMEFTATADFESKSSYDVTVEVDDSNVGSDPDDSESFSLSINDVNEPPTVTTNSGLSLNEGTTAAIGTGALSASDEDAGDGAPALTFSVASGPSNGTLLVSSAVASSFTQQNLVDGVVEYQHDGSETTSDSFTFDLTDDEGAGPTGETFSITVTAQNDAPTIATNQPVPVTQGQTAGLTQSDLEATDPETTDPSNFTYTIDTDATEGQLVNTNTSTPLDQGATFTQADLNNGNLEYQSSSTTSARSDAIDFTVADGAGGSTSGTVDLVLSPAPYGSGTALTLDGSGDFVALPDESAFDFTGDFTVSFWMKVDSDGFSSDFEALVVKGESAWRIQRAGTNNTLSFDTDHGSADAGLASATPVDDGAWHHVAAVYDRTGGEKRLYVDGVLDASTAESRAVDQSDDPVRIGSNASITGREYGGQIDQVRLYTTVLTDAQIQARAYRTLDVGGSAAQDLVAAYRFDAGSGSTAYDVIGGHDGTLQADAGFTAFSGVPIGQQSTVVQSGSESLGPSGGTVLVENVSTSGSDALVVSQHGTTGGPAVTSSQSGEDFSQITDDVTRRLNVVWGLSAVGSPSADVTLDYSTLSGLSSTENVRLLRRSGGPGTPWQDVSGSWTWDEAAQTFSKTGVSSFSQYAIGEAATALPVELASLEGRAIENGVQLIWQTASETSNAGFELQRKSVKASRTTGMTSGPRDASTVSEDWQTIGTVEGAGTTTEVQSYRFIDADIPYQAKTLTYRLKQVDTDGSTSYSKAITVDRRAAKQVELLGTYPNPARQRATVRFALPSGSSEDVRLRLYDVMGREVRTVEAGVQTGRHEVQLDVSDLSSGVYFLRLQAGTTVKTQRLTVLR